MLSQTNMRPAILFCLSAWLACIPARASAPYGGSWESLQKMPVPAWFDDGEIGIFIHWGPYSVLGYKKGDQGYAEQVPKAIYSDPKHHYPLLKQRFGAAPPEFGYKDFVDDYVARWKEIEKKYQPDFLWIDDIPLWTRDGNKVLKGTEKPEIQYFYDQLRLMITDFMNEGVRRGQPVYLNNKGGNVNWPEGVGCREKDNLRLAQLGPKWQSCTTFGTSFGYLAAGEADDYPHKKKNAGEVIHEMIEVVSRNGNFLINISPRADGTIPEWQVERLRAMGTWLKINEDAIYGSRYWHTTHQKNGHLAFTTNGKKLYVICLEKPQPFTIEATKGWTAADVESVRLLGSEAKVEWALDENGLRIIPPADLGASPHAWAFEILTHKEQHTPTAISTGLKEKRRAEIHTEDSTDYTGEKK